MIKIKTTIYSSIIFFYLSSLACAQTTSAQNSSELSFENQKKLEAFKNSLVKEQVVTKTTEASSILKNPIIFIVPPKNDEQQQLSDSNQIKTNKTPQEWKSQEIQGGSKAEIPQEILSQNSLGNNLVKSTNLSDPDLDSVSTSDAIDQIQKTLIFSGEVKPKKGITQKKPSNNISHSSGSSSKVDILVMNPSNRGNAKNRQKEQIAYNASIAGQYEVAIAIYKQILKSEPENHYASFALAACYHKLGQYKQAKTIYYKLLKKEWADEKTKEQLIGNLLEVIVEESPNDAVYLLGKLIDQNPQSAYIMAGSAMAYDKINKPDQAILLLKRAIYIDPEEITYKFNLAVIYDKIGDYQNAISGYQAVVRKYVTSGNLDDSIALDQVRQRIEFIQNKI